MVYAMALHNYVEDNCKQYEGDRMALRSCIDRDLFMKYIRKVSFQGLVKIIWSFYADSINIRKF